jgi:hypothetical protein
LKGIFKLAFKLLVNDTAKFTALLMGITFAVFLMMFVTSMFVGVLNHASATVINIGSTIWVMDPAVETRYKAGLDPYLNFIAAQTALLSDQQLAVTLRIERSVAEVQLIKALGGGWNASQIPSSTEIEKGQ